MSSQEIGRPVISERCSTDTAEDRGLSVSDGSSHPSFGGHHLSGAERGISLFFPYNHLQFSPVFDKGGVVRPVLIEPEEQRFDGNPADHGHFKCLRCGEIYDFPLDPELLNQLCPQGYCTESQDVYYTGICARCSKSSPQ